MTSDAGADAGPDLRRRHPGASVAFAALRRIGAAARALVVAPIRLLVDARPVFERDFLVFTSRRRFLALRTVTVVAAAAVVFAALAGMGADRVAREPASVGRSVAQIGVFLVPIIVLLLAPILSASSIASERALHTLTLVLAAPGSAASFVLAKFLSRLGVVLVLAAATLPVVATCFLFGGVSVAAYLDTAAFAAGVAVMGVAAGTLASALCRTVSGAVRVALFLGLGLPILQSLAYKALDDWLNASASLPGWFLHSNLFRAWASVGGRQTRALGAGAGVEFAGWMAGAAVVALAFASWRMSREARIESRAGSARRRSMPYRRANPVFERAARGALFVRPNLGAWLRLGVVVLTVGAVLGIAIAEDDLDRAMTYDAVLWCVTPILAIMVLSQTAHGVAAERQAGSLDLLMATPLRARAVVGGKFDAAVVGLAPLYAIPLLAGLVGTVVSDFDGRSLLAWFCTSSMLAVFVIAVGLCASVRSATAGGATIRAFTLLVGGMLLHAIVIVILALALSGKMRIAEVDLWLWLGAASPVALVAGSTWAVTDIQGQGGDWVYPCAFWYAMYLLAIPLLLRRAVRVLDAEPARR